MCISEWKCVRFATEDDRDSCECLDVASWARAKMTAMSLALRCTHTHIHTHTHTQTSLSFHSCVDPHWCIPQLLTVTITTNHLTPTLNFTLTFQFRVTVKVRWKDYNTLEQIDSISVCVCVCVNVYVWMSTHLISHNLLSGVLLFCWYLSVEFNAIEISNKSTGSEGHRGIEA